MQFSRGLGHHVYEGYQPWAVLAVSVAVFDWQLFKSCAMEETDTSMTTKVSDSAYSNSCNSKSQRSSESSKSRLSNSSGSSGYGDNPSTLSSHNGVTPQDPEMKRIKKKEHKKKKHKGGGCDASEQETIISSEYSCSSHKVLGTSREGPNCPDSDHHPGVAPSSDIDKTDQLPSVDPASVEKTPQNQVTRQAQELLTPSQCPPSNTYSCVETCVNKFSAGVSMQQGTVIYTTGPLTDILGFPEDMWVGRSFIDFVHPKDRTVLTAFITARVANIITSSFDSAEIVRNKDLIFCSLRQYRGLRSSGFGVTEKKVTYLPFQLTLNFIGPAPSKEDFILLVTATPVTSIYKCPDEIHTSSKFVTHQLSDMSLSHVDPEVVTHMGYFPQDMLNRSIFDFYHPEDLPFFKEVYQTIMKKKGPPFRSKPYRFRVHNGSFVLIETEWSSFVNPWSKKLELIVGQHSIFKGPTNPDVFAERPENTSPQISEELLKQSKVIQDEIICLLTEMVVDSALSPKLQVSKLCKDMATFMESLMGEVSKIDLKVEEQSISEKGSATLGGISLHNANGDNTTSTDTPPSYNQLNYNDNIQRFFESRPKTTPSVGSRELKTEMNKPLMIPVNISKCSASGDSTLASSNNRKCCAPLNNTSGGSNSSDRAAITHNGTNTSHVSYKPPHLTEAILWRHNEHMEKKMVQKHQEQLSKGDHRETESKKCQQLQTNNNQDPGVHGVKRSGSHSWEGKPFKGSKHPHVDEISEEPSPTTNMPPPLSHWPTAKMTPLHQGPSNINQWPPFSVTMTPLHPTIPATTNSYSTPPPIYPQMTNMIPLYYFPSGVQPQENPETPTISVKQPSPDFLMPPVSYMNMPGIMHPGMMQPIYQGSLMYQPNMVMLHPASVVPTVKTHVSSPAALFHYPMFLATSPIAEPRSNFGSIAPASINKSMLEQEGDKEWSLSQEKGDKKYSLCTENETSYSSLYSFLKTTDKSDDSMEENSKSEDMTWDKTDAKGGKKARPVLRDPPWMEGVFVNPDLVYRYKLDERIMADILQADLKALNKTHQPLLVNNQLTQLYEDMEEEGLSKDCLEESLPSSSSSGEDSNNHPFTQPSSGKVKKRRRRMEYSKLVMIFEENAPLPPPTSSR